MPVDEYSDDEGRRDDESRRLGQAGNYKERRRSDDADVRTGSAVAPLQQ
jgi:hypothetical protein